VPKRSAKLFFYLRNEIALADILLAIALHAPTKSDAELGAALRFVTSNVLEAVIRFLQSADLPSATLARLLQALRELNEGHGNPLFTAPKITHRRTDSLPTVGCKAVAAAAMQFYMDARVSKNDAASKVATSLQKTPFRYYGSKPISPRMVASWRDRCIGAHGKADVPAYIFQMMLTNMRGRFSTPTKQAEGVLAVLYRITLTPPLISTR